MSVSGGSACRAAQRRLVVHVGMPKCGSTSVQGMLAALSPRLARAGVLVPRAGSAAPGNHHNLWRAEVGHRTHRPTRGGWAELRGEIGASAASLVVLSSELFTLPDGRRGCAGRVAELAAATGAAVTVVGYVRPQAAWLESWYAERVRSADEAATFEAFAARMLGPSGEDLLDYNRVFAPWREAFGDAVRVFPLEAPGPAQGVDDHFLATLGVATPALLGALRRLGPLRANLRMGAAELETRRCVAAAVAGRPVADRRRAARRLVHLPALVAPDRPFAGFDAAGAAAVARRFGGANARFARDYAIDAGGALFRDTAGGAGPDRGRAGWEDLDAGDRRRVRHFVARRSGIDLGAPDASPPAQGAAGWRLDAAVWLRIGRCYARRLPGVARVWRQALAPRSPHRFRLLVRHRLTGRTG